MWSGATYLTTQQMAGSPAQFLRGTFAVDQLLQANQICDGRP
jgi:hypothetical protein